MEINQCKNQFFPFHILYIIILNLLFFMNLFADFFKFFKCRLFKIIQRNLQKMFEH